ncbi:ferritin heavy chain B [Ixodes scapularis]
MKQFVVLLALIGAATSGNNLFENLDKYPLQDECQAALQEHINVEMHASLVYMQMAAHFDNNKVARKGFSTFFAENSKEEREHAQKIIDYINKRGSTVSLVNIDMPQITTWKSVLQALRDAISLENKVTNKLHAVHKTADEECKDPQMQSPVHIGGGVLPHEPPGEEDAGLRRSHGAEL